VRSSSNGGDAPLVSSGGEHCAFSYGALDGKMIFLLQVIKLSSSFDIVHLDLV
jgi:hypothetical protein